ncbi:CatB-related O-acetyltransferase [Frigidibacter sp. ROC022]|uniref:CatB-related O-acetyltransferase n=1 Tax=Frigidibacter sp. ROC022 TaxID=2971796 RepID=UPI00215A9C70|nr:CatB-related O-acetyltransferase [Frigidibacter sp. ROC022]MCR8726531.1 CatB-related O-acetyltransferase [Frigidibacter sp. ROC022]
MSAFLDAARRHPLILPDGRPHPNMVNLNRVISHPNIEIGDFTYMNDFAPPESPGGWAARIAPYLYPGAPERLRIGRFGQFAHGATFITASANHPMDGASTYPFAIFDHALLETYRDSFRGLPDTEIGNDVWIGHGALILPGARLGNGVIVGAGAVVRGAVPDYAVVAGNPARVLRMRFQPGTVARLNALAWWDWPEARIEAAVPALARADIDALEALA